MGRHTVRMSEPEPPIATFASDNTAGVHPEVLDAIARANVGQALPYGEDDETAECEQRFNELFGQEIVTKLVFNGTGANVVALAGLLGPAESVLCSAWAHILLEEGGASERILGAKLVGLANDDAKITPDQIISAAHDLGDQHHAQPAVVSITQATELGTVYTAPEIAAICEAAHALGLTVHMDGARISNAVAALGNSAEALRSMTIDAGVDVMTFGGTKNGLLGAEAVLFLNPELGARSAYLRKMTTQLSSKMRFLAAQFNALLNAGLWLQLAGHANAMATELQKQTASVDGVQFDRPPVVNSVFPRLPSASIKPLQDWSFFWDWDRANGQVRWMTSWSTTAEDIDRFASGVERLLAPTMRGTIDGARSGA
jgi:threonine aldolase